MVTLWMNLRLRTPWLKNGQHFLNKAERIAEDPFNGPPSMAVIIVHINKVHDMVLTGYRVKLREIVKAMRISTEGVHHILTVVLGLSTVAQDRCRD